MPCFPDRPLCLVNFKHFSSFLQRCSGLGRAAKPPDLRSFASGNTQYKLTLASTFPEQGVSPLTRWDCRPYPANGLCPLTPTGCCAPVPGTKGLHPSVLPHRRSWLPPQKRFCQFHRLRIRTFTPIDGKWIRNTSAGIAGQSSGCRPGVFS